MGYLIRRNILTYKAPPNNAGYDLICIHPDPRKVTKQIRVQVKSRLATDGDGGFPVKGRTIDAFDYLIAATFMDVKNACVGLGLTQVSIVRNERRDALCLLTVLAHTFLTLLEKAGQELGMERMVGATGPKQRSFFCQGLRLLALIPTMRADRLRALVQKVGELLQGHVLFTGLLGVL